MLIRQRKFVFCIKQRWFGLVIQFTNAFIKPTPSNQLKCLMLDQQCWNPALTHWKFVELPSRRTLLALYFIYKRIALLNRWHSLSDSLLDNNLQLALYRRFCRNQGHSVNLKGKSRYSCSTSFGDCIIVVWIRRQSCS